MRIPVLLSLIVIMTGAFCPRIWAQSDSTFPTAYIHDADKAAKEAVGKIVRYTGLSPNFTVIRSDVKTATAYIKGGKRYIAYNPEFIFGIRTKSKTDWAAVSVLAHEIGHHLAGHTLRSRGSNPGDELAADKFSGFILYHMGASLDEAKAALNAVGHDIDTLRHPPKRARLEAITNGWLEAENLDDIPAYGADAEKKDSLNVLFQCEFRNDENLYFVDDRNRIIWYDNVGTPIVLGQKVPSKSSNFVWLYQYERFSFGVDSRGNIWEETNFGTQYKVGKVLLVNGPVVDKNQE